MITVEQIIEMLGGQDAVADALGCTPYAIMKWRYQDRIPPIRWGEIVELGEGQIKFSDLRRD